MYKEEAYYTNDGERVTTKTTHFTSRFHDEKGYALYAYGNTISSRISVSFPEGMSKTDIANMVLLAKKLQPFTNVLGYRGNKGYKAMDIKQMGKAIGLQERQAYRFIKRMTDIGMVARSVTPVLGGHEVQYIVNPLYFMNGKTISDSLYKIFQDQLDKQLPAWVKETYRKRTGTSV